MTASSCAALDAWSLPGDEVIFFASTSRGGAVGGGEERSRHRGPLQIDGGRELAGSLQHS